MQVISTNTQAPRPAPAPAEEGRAKPGAGNDVRLALASAVYEASYMSGSLAFPWDLALSELNALKQAAARRSQTGREPQAPPGSAARAVDRPK